MSRGFRLFLGMLLFLIGVGIHENVDQVTFVVFGCSQRIGSMCIQVSPQLASLTGGIAWVLMVGAVVLAATAFLRKEKRIDKPAVGTSQPNQ